MSKMNDLSTLLTELSQTGQQLMEAGRTLMLTASRIQDCIPVSEDNDPEPKPKGRKPRKEPEPVSDEPVPNPPAEPAPEAPAAPEYTKEEIRGMLSDLAGKVITGPTTRWSYVNIWDPKSINGGTPKYSVSLIIPKTDTETIRKIKDAIRAAYEEGENKLRGSGRSVPALEDLKTPLRDGDRDRKDDPNYPPLRLQR